MSGQIIFREKVLEIVTEVPKSTNLKKVNFQNYLTQLFADDLVISPSLRYKEKQGKIRSVRKTLQKMRVKS